MPNMTKQQAIAKFKREVLPNLPDSITARHFAWDAFVTALRDNGDVTRRAARWAAPSFVLR
jgi:hypothetical protein